jgi:hypothetical protein
MRHKMDYARSQIQVWELEFELRNKYLPKELTGSWSVGSTRLIYQYPHEK